MNTGSKLAWTLLVGTAVVGWPSAVVLPVASSVAAVPTKIGITAPKSEPDELLSPARDRLAASLSASPQLKIDLANRVAAMNAAELLQTNQQSVVPAARAFDEIVKSYRADAQKLMEPMREAIGTQEALAKQERSASIHIVLGEPKEISAGYQGKFDGQIVYIETAKHKPRALPNSIRLGMLDGLFVRSGTIEGTNAFGAKVTLPKFIDAPDVEQAKRDLLVRQLAEVESREDSILREASEKHARGFTTTYRAILDRAVALAEADIAAISETAKKAAGEPASEQRVKDAAEALAAIEWKPGVGAQWAEQIDAVLKAASEQFSKPRSDLDSAATAKLGDTSTLLNSLAVGESPLSVGHAARTLMADIASGTKKAAVLGQFDMKRGDYDSRLRGGLSEQAIALIRQRKNALELTPAQDGLAVDHIASDGADVLVAADFGPDQRNEQNQTLGVLRIQNGRVTDTTKIAVDPTEHDAWPEGARVLVRPLEGGWLAIQHGACVSLVTPTKKTAMLPGTGADDLWRVKTKLLGLSRGTTGGESPGLYSVTSEGEVQRVGEARDFAIVDGKGVVISRQMGGGSDRVDVIDSTTNQPVPEFAAAWARLRDFDPNGNGTQAAIALGRVWVFNLHGVEGLSTGPTLIPIDFTGKFGQPLFAHQSVQTDDNGNGGAVAQTVGSTKLVVAGADNEIVMTQDRAYVYGKPDEQSLSGTVVAFDLAAQREVWMEANLRDQFNAVTEARRSHKEDGPGVLKFTLIDKPNRGEVKIVDQAIPISIEGKQRLVEVTIRAEGQNPISWLLPDDGTYAKNVAGIDRGRILRHSGRWYFGSSRVESIKTP